MLKSLKNGRCSLIFTTHFTNLDFRKPFYLCIQPLLQSPPKTRSSTSVDFHLPMLPLLDHKIIFVIPTLPSAIPQHFLTSLYLRKTIPIYICVKPNHSVYSLIKLEGNTLRLHVGIRPQHQS